MPIESVDRNVIHRSYYYANCDDFLNASEAEIRDEIVQHSMQFDLTAQQNIAWNEEIRILKQVMRELGDGQIAFEYTIPRMGRRVDVVIIRKGQIFLLEFKVFEKEYPKNAVDQAVDYAVDLHNFHEASHDTDLFPVLVCTEAPIEVNNIVLRNHIASPMRCNEHNLASEIKRISEAFETSESLDANAWVNSLYKPTPTIIEAAQALYAGHDVREISHKESDDNDIAVTTACIDEIIENSKRNGWKSICFVTGVPGAGKTLVGLNIANRRHRFNTGDEEHAVFLSGNEPLVTVLREALTRDQDEKRKQVCDSCKKTKKRQDRDCDNCKFHLTKEAIFKETKSFIQMIHWFRDDSLLDGHPAPIDKIAIFDEAQRAWKKEKLSNFMRTKKGQPHFDMSEPECLIEYMNRHRDWATIVCLVGGGQEIHDGEAGISEWFNALNTHFPDWKVFCSDRMTDSEYVGDSSVDALLSNVELHKRSELHLSVSMRSFRSELVSAFAKAVIDADVDEARRLYTQITEANADGSMKYGEPFTKAIAMYMNKYFNTSYLIKVNDTGLDSNRDNHDEFKDELLRIVKENDIKLVIDLHGADKNRDFDVEFGTLNDLSADISTIKELEKAFINKGIVNLSYNDPFKGGAITQYLFNVKDLDVIQLEINWRFRNVENIENLELLCKALEEFITQYVECISREID